MKIHLARNKIRLILVVTTMYVFFFLYFFNRDTFRFGFLSDISPIIVTIFAMLISLSIVIFMRLNMIPRSKEEAFFTRVKGEYKGKEKKFKGNISKLKKELKQKNDLIQNYKGAFQKKDAALFLRTTPKDKLYHKTIKEKINNASESICIATTLLDHILSNDISSLKDKCEIKIICKSQKSGNKNHEDAYNLLKSTFKKNLKTNQMLHSRLIIIDNSEIIVGSADLDSQSMNNNLESGVYSKNPEIVSEASKFFDYLWKNSR